MNPILTFKGSQIESQGLINFEEKEEEEEEEIRKKKTLTFTGWIRLLRGKILAHSQQPLAELPTLVVASM